MSSDVPRYVARRYVAPLREGGSLPGIVEADDLGTYVCKFRGAGQGLKVLVAEVVVGELARALGILVPALALIEVDAEIGRREPDEEVQELVTASAFSRPGATCGRSAPRFSTIMDTLPPMVSVIAGPAALYAIGNSGAPLARANSS